MQQQAVDVVYNLMAIFKRIIILVLNLSLCQVDIAQSTVNLKGTQYIMNLPDLYKIQKKQGIDYEEFYLWNTSKMDSSNAFVMFGCCVGTIGKYLGNAKKIDSVKQILLGREIQWAIYDLDSNYLAETIIIIDDFEKVVFGIKSKKRREISKLIRSFGTLQKKQ
ncbi:MAG TPA: hypothetical protein VKR58_07430 [Aquella sp.]|nr:hypothetical protein [Aquella sp.]